MGTAYFNAFSDGYIDGKFNEIPWQKMGDDGHYGSCNPGRRLAGLDDGRAHQILCSAGLGLRLASEDFCCIFTSFRAT